MTVDQWQIQGGGGGGGKGGASVPPFGLHLTLRSTDEKTKWNPPPFLAIELRKLLLWLTLECFRRKFVRKQIDWTGRAGSLSQNDRNGRGFSLKWVWLLKFCARFARKTLLLPPF